MVADLESKVLALLFVSGTYSTQFVCVCTPLLLHILNPHFTFTDLADASGEVQPLVDGGREEQPSPPTQDAVGFLRPSASAYNVGPSIQM